jgi:hypothetical protein
LRSPRSNCRARPAHHIRSLAGAASVAASLGSSLFGPEYTGPGFKVRNGCDPEGNVLQVRENAR